VVSVRPNAWINRSTASMCRCSEEAMFTNVACGHFPASACTRRERASPPVS
jgi:hypothetical protein